MDQKLKRHKFLISLAAMLTGVSGLLLVAQGRADTFLAHGEAESGGLGGNAALHNDATASGGQSVLFGQAGSSGPGAGDKLGSHISFGAFTVHAGTDDGEWTPSDITALEAKIGHKVSPVQYFGDLSAPFRLADCQQLAKGGRDMLVALEPNVATASVIAGAADGFIKQFAADTAKCPAKVYIRLYPEMNGSFTAYSPYHDQDYPGTASMHTANPAQLVQATRHIIDVFRSVNGGNVRWVFCPNQTDEPDVAANKFETYYPGSNYVDVLAFDAYNWGNGGPFGSWQSARDVYAESYKRLTALHATAPVWVTETSSKEPTVDDGYGKNAGKSKGAWITDLFAMTDFPRIQAVVWFDINKQTSPPDSGERDWRVDSSADSLNALKAALKNTP